MYSKIENIQIISDLKAKSQVIAIYRITIKTPQTLFSRVVKIVYSKAQTVCVSVFSPKSEKFNDLFEVDCQSDQQIYDILKVVAEVLTNHEKLS